MYMSFYFFIPLSSSLVLPNCSFREKYFRMGTFDKGGEEEEFPHLLQIYKLDFFSPKKCAFSSSCSLIHFNTFVWGFFFLHVFQNISEIQALINILNIRITSAGDFLRVTTSFWFGAIITGRDNSVSPGHSYNRINCTDSFLFVWILRVFLFVCLLKYS